MAEVVAMHFNDLIMRIRTFALPFLATVIGAGSALSQLSDETDVRIPWFVLGFVLIFAGALYLLFIIYASVFWREPNRRFRVNPLEYIGLALIVTSLFAWFVVAVTKMWDVGVFDTQEVSFAAPVLGFGSLIFLSIYLLDRFYYTAMLLGAVGRAESLERSSGRRVNLSHEISFAAQRWTYTVLPTVLYVLPLVILINAAAAVAVTGGGESMSESPNGVEAAATSTPTPTATATPGMTSGCQGLDCGK